MTSDRPSEHRAWQARRAAIISRYGTAEAACAPCERERRIIASVAPWRVVSTDGWTDTLDGWRGSAAEWRNAPARVLAAIRAALPMPATLADAVMEASHWSARDAEIRDVLAVDGPSADDEGLDLPALLRWGMVRALVEHELPATMLQDVRARVAMLRSTTASRIDIVAALDRDLAAMIECQASAASQVSTQRGHVIELLRAHPDWSDRQLARTAGCSPTTAGKARRALG